MRVLITGGCGFIGTNLTNYLFRRGYKIKILDTYMAAPCQAYDHIIADIRNELAVKKAVDGVNAVIHLAAFTSVMESIENPYECWGVNVNGTHNLLSCCNKLIFASSNAAEYSLSPYGASKRAGEALCSAYYHSFGVKTVSLRFANVYGPHMEHKTSVIQKFVEAAKWDEPLTIYGDGEQTRDFIHVNDICEAIHLALTGNSWGQTFQIGTGVPTSINELTELIKKTTKSESTITYEPKRTGEVDQNYSDITKAKEVLGFSPKISLKDGLATL